MNHFAISIWIRPSHSSLLNHLSLSFSKANEQPSVMSSSKSFSLCWRNSLPCAAARDDDLGSDPTTYCYTIIWALKLHIMYMHWHEKISLPTCIRLLNQVVSRVESSRIESCRVAFTLCWAGWSGGNIWDIWFCLCPICNARARVYYKKIAQWNFLFTLFV